MKIKKTISHSEYKYYLENVEINEHQYIQMARSSSHPGDFSLMSKQVGKRNCNIIGGTDVDSGSSTISSLQELAIIAHMRHLLSTRNYQEIREILDSLPIDSWNKILYEDPDLKKTLINFMLQQDILTVQQIRIIKGFCTYNELYRYLIAHYTSLRNNPYVIDDIEKIEKKIIKIIICECSGCRNCMSPGSAGNTIQDVFEGFIELLDLCEPKHILDRIFMPIWLGPRRNGFGFRFGKCQNNMSFALIETDLKYFRLASTIVNNSWNTMSIDTKKEVFNSIVTRFYSFPAFISFSYRELVPGARPVRYEEKQYEFDLLSAQKINCRFIFLKHSDSQFGSIDEFVFLDSQTRTLTKPKRFDFEHINDFKLSNIQLVDQTSTEGATKLIELASIPRRDQQQASVDQMLTSITIMVNDIECYTPQFFTPTVNKYHSFIL